MSKAEKLDRLIADQLKAELPREAVIGRQVIVLEQTMTHVGGPVEGMLR